MRKIKETLKWADWGMIVPCVLIAIVVIIVLALISFVIYCEIKGVPMGATEEGLSVAVRTAMNITQ